MTKKAVITEAGQDIGYVVTCKTVIMPTRVVGGTANFQGCTVEESSEADVSLVKLSFKDLLIKLGGKPVLTIPDAPFCHTRAC